MGTYKASDKPADSRKTFFVIRYQEGAGLRYDHTVSDIHTPEGAAEKAEELAIRTRLPVVILQAIEVISPVTSVEAIRLE